MPTFRQAAFLPRALDSLLAQQLADWEAVIVDDGSPDETEAIVSSVDDERVRYVRLPRNRGMGAALNVGLVSASADLVAYLPSDDVWYPEHLATLVACLDAAPDAIMAIAGVRHHYNHAALGPVPDHGIQLVQVLHRPTAERWMERDELVTDDLERMFWGRLASGGSMVQTGTVTCEWVEHPEQRHKLLSEPEGGIARYRARFAVSEPIRFHTRRGNLIDEPALYQRFSRSPTRPVSPDGLKILLVGELAYNPERILALEELGHRLYGLWMPDPYWLNTVGPLPFGHVEDLPRIGWQDAVRRIKPDVIYALLNWQAVPFAHHVVDHNPGVPFVWHFKEGPFICIDKGTWPLLAELYRRSDGQIYTSPEQRDWTFSAIPEAANSPHQLVLDGDLPKREWLESATRPWRRANGEIHTVVAGRPIGLHPESVAELARRRIHLHFYGDFTHGQWRAWIDRANAIAPGHLHLHSHVDQRGWSTELSKYDAGWLHVFASENGGDVRRATWDDLNYPARLPTYVAAGLPIIHYDNRGAVVASQRLCEELGIGVPFADFDELASRLRDTRTLDAARKRVNESRERFTFDHHAPALVNFFRAVIASTDGGTRPRPPLRG